MPGENGEPVVPGTNDNPGADGTNPNPAPPTPQLNHAEVERMIRDSVNQALAHIQIPAAAPAAVPAAAPVDTRTFLEQAEAEAEAKGINNYDWITNRTAELASLATEKRILNLVGGMLIPIATEREAQKLAGENKFAQEYAAKLVAKGYDTNDPDVQDMIRRASASYAAEKAPPAASVTVEQHLHSGNMAIASELRQEADMMADIAARALGYGPEDAARLRLTDADLLEIGA